MDKVPAKLRPLAEEAVKYDTFDEFKTAFLRDIKHGRYYHVTDNPDFEIDSLTGPRDMSSMSGQAVPDKGKLMVTSDLTYWAEEYKGTRPYVAIIDMSEVPKEDYWQVNRGFGNEIWVDDPSMARVIKVVPMGQAKVDARLHHNALEERITGSSALERFYDEVMGLAEVDESVSLMDEGMDVPEVTRSVVGRIPEGKAGMKGMRITTGVGDVEGIPATYEDSHGELFEIHGVFGTRGEAETEAELVRSEGSVSVEIQQVRNVWVVYKEVSG